MGQISHHIQNFWTLQKLYSWQSYLSVKVSIKFDWQVENLWLGRILWKFVVSFSCIFNVPQKFWTRLFKNACVQKRSEVFYKKVFLKNSQYSWEHTCFGVYFLMKLSAKARNFVKKGSHTGVFLWILLIF